MTHRTLEHVSISIQSSKRDQLLLMLTGNPKIIILKVEKKKEEEEEEKKKKLISYTRTSREKTNNTQTTHRAKNLNVKPKQNNTKQKKRKEN